MGRRKGFIEDLLDMAMQMPPWLSLASAALLYFGLRAVAYTDVPNPADGPERFAAIAMFRGVALYAQYVLPMVFVFGAVGGLRKRRNREHLYASARRRNELGTLLSLGWREFEWLVGEVFRNKGFTVLEQGGGGPDGGYDLVLTKGSERFLVQCKQWRAGKVGVTVIRELYGLMTAHGAAGGYVVTTGTYTRDAVAFAEGRNLTLIDGSELLDLIGAEGAEYSSEKSPKSSANGLADIESPICEKCGAVMIKRIAGKGPNRGNAFWGCGAYPACKHIVPINKR